MHHVGIASPSGAIPTSDSATALHPLSIVPHHTLTAESGPGTPNRPSFRKRKHLALAMLLVCMGLTTGCSTKMPAGPYDELQRYEAAIAAGKPVPDANQVAEEACSSYRSAYYNYFKNPNTNREVLRAAGDDWTSCDEKSRAQSEEQRQTRIAQSDARRADQVNWDKKFIVEKWWINGNFVVRAGMVIGLLMLVLFLFSLAGVNKKSSPEQPPSPPTPSPPPPPLPPPPSPPVAPPPPPPPPHLQLHLGRPLQRRHRFHWIR